MTNAKKNKIEYGFVHEDQGFVFGLMFFHQKYLAGITKQLTGGFFPLHFWCVFLAAKRIVFLSQKSVFFCFFEFAIRRSGYSKRETIIPEVSKTIQRLF